MSAVPFPANEWNTFLQAADRAGVVLPDKLFGIDSLFVDPSPLGDAAKVWTDDIQSALKSVAGDITFEVGRTTDHWSGTASEAFRDWTHQFGQEIKKPTGEPLSRVARALRQTEDAFGDAQQELAAAIVEIGGEAATALAGGELEALVGLVVTAITSLVGFVNVFDEVQDAAAATFNAIGNDFEGIGRTVANLGQQLATDADLAKVNDTHQWQPR